MNPDGTLTAEQLDSVANRLFSLGEQDALWSKVDRFFPSLADICISVGKGLGDFLPVGIAVLSAARSIAVEHLDEKGVEMLIANTRYVLLQMEERLEGLRDARVTHE
jgi:hypothetical protein